MKWTRGVSAALSLIAAPAASESLLVLVDDVGTQVGEVISIGPGRNEGAVALPLGNGEFAILEVDWNGFGPSATRAYFEAPDCQGQAYIDASSLGRLLNPIFHVSAHGSPTPVQILVTRDRGAVPQQILYQSSAFPGGGCDSNSTTRMVVPATYVMDFPSFVGPFHVETNPTIFWDQFQTGDLTRWSNY